MTPMQPQETQDALDFLDGAKDIFLCHYFAFILSQGLTWEEIFRTLTYRIRDNDEKGKEGSLSAAEVKRHLQLAAESLELKAEDFPRLQISPFEFDQKYFFKTEP